MALIELEMSSGFYSEQSPRGAKGRWRLGDHVRFRYGRPEKLKGFVNYEELTVIPPVRAVHFWSSLDNQKWLALASDQKLYIINNDTLYDITPLDTDDGGTGTGTLTNPFATINGSPEVSVTDADHGLEEGQIVIYSGASTVAGLTLNGTFTVASIFNLDTYTITAASNANLTTTGGGSVTYVYEMSPPPGATQYLGWGSGPYGVDDDPLYLGDGWGTPRFASGLVQATPVWSLDSWGEDLIASRLGGPIYIWERSNGPGTRARKIDAAPAANNWIVVSAEDRHLVSLGSHDGTQRDQMLVRWSDQEDYNEWESALDNTAGDKRLDSGSKIVTAVETRGETIIFTDEAIYSMQFIGGDDIFQFSPKGESLTILSPNAAVELGGIIYAMMRDEFIAYSGVVQILPCTVRSYVFDTINREMVGKVFAAVNREQSEVWWFYPSAGSDENNRYVILNVRDGDWYYGTMDRTAYVDAGFKEYPIAVDSDGVLYLQENGLLADGEAYQASLQSWDVEINNIGQEMAHVTRFIPDFMTLEGSVNFYFTTKKYPTSAAVEKGPYPVTDATRKVSLRARGRQISVRIEDVSVVEGVAQEVDWRMGTLRVDAQEDGER